LSIIIFHFKISFLQLIDIGEERGRQES